MKILGIDPGTGITGFGVIEANGTNYKMIDAGVIRTKPNSPLPSRLKIIYSHVKELLDEHKPEFMSVEKLFFAQNVTTAISVSHARGVVLLAGEQNGVKVNRVPSVCWFTSLDHGRRHQPLSLMTVQDNFKYSKHKDIKGKKSYDYYDNYDAIEVPIVHAIPSDYDGVMGVPITFIDKYNPEQFEIIGSDAYDGTPPTKTYPKKSKVKDGKKMKSQTGTMGCVMREDKFGSGTYFDVGYPVRAVYKRIFIRHKRG